MSQNKKSQLFCRKALLNDANTLFEGQTNGKNRLFSRFQNKMPGNPQKLVALQTPTSHTRVTRSYRLKCGVVGFCGLQRCITLWIDWRIFWWNGC